MDKRIDQSMRYEITKILRNRLNNDPDMRKMLFDISLELWDEIICHYADHIEQTNGIYDEEGEFVPHIAGITVWDEMRGEYLYVPLTTIEFNHLEHMNDVLGDANVMLDMYHEICDGKVSA
jgi:hypothetical protein